MIMFKHHEGNTCNFDFSLILTTFKSQLRRKENQSHLKADGDGNLFKHLLPLTLILGCISKERNLYAARRQFLIMFPFFREGIWLLRVYLVRGTSFYHLSLFFFSWVSTWISRLLSVVSLSWILEVTRDSHEQHTCLVVIKSKNSWLSSVRVKR